MPGNIEPGWAPSHTCGCVCECGEGVDIVRVYDQKRRYLPNSLHLCAWISVQLYASHLALSCVKQELASFYNKLWLTAIA